MPGGIEIIKNHRQFAVIVELLEHANNGPYSFKLYGKPTSRNSERSLIGAVSVFARQDSSPCAGCQGRRAQATTVLGIIFIDEDFVEQIVEDTGRGGLDDIAEAVKGSLHAELQDPRGIKLSITFGVDSQQVQQKSELIYPRGVVLVSTGAALQTGNPDAPYQWVDWATHGNVFRVRSLRITQFITMLTSSYRSTIGSVDPIYKESFHGERLSFKGNRISRFSRNCQDYACTLKEKRLCQECFECTTESHWGGNDPGDDPVC